MKDKVTVTDGFHVREDVGPSKSRVSEKTSDNGIYDLLPPAPHNRPGSIRWVWRREGTPVLAGREGTPVLVWYTPPPPSPERIRDQTLGYPPPPPEKTMDQRLRYPHPDFSYMKEAIA